MGIFALQSIAGGFLDEDLKNFNKVFDDCKAKFPFILSCSLKVKY